MENSTFLDIIYETSDTHDMKCFDNLVDEAKNAGIDQPREYILRNYEFDREFWERLSCQGDFSDEFMDEFKESLDWGHLCENRSEITDEFVDKWVEWVDWCGISYNNTLTKEFIYGHLDLLEFDVVVKFHDMPEEFMWENRYRIDWSDYCENEIKSMSFVDRFIEFLPIEDVVRTSPDVAHDTMMKYGDRIKWRWVVKHCHVPEDVLDKWHDRIPMDDVSMYQTLSENFMVKYCDDLYWPFVSMYQHMSEEFIRKMSGYVYLDDVMKNRLIPQSVKNKFIK